MIDFLWWFVASSHTFYLYLKPAILFNAYYANVFLSLLKFPYVPFPQFLATGEWTWRVLLEKWRIWASGKLLKMEEHPVSWKKNGTFLILKRGILNANRFKKWQLKRDSRRWEKSFLINKWITYKLGSCIVCKNVQERQLSPFINIDEKLTQLAIIFMK